MFGLKFQSIEKITSSTVIVIMLKFLGLLWTGEAIMYKEPVDFADGYWFSTVPHSVDTT